MKYKVSTQQSGTGKACKDGKCSKDGVCKGGEDKLCKQGDGDCPPAPAVDCVLSKCGGNNTAGKHVEGAWGPCSRLCQGIQTQTVIVNVSRSGDGRSCPSPPTCPEQACNAKCAATAIHQLKLNINFDTTVKNDRSAFDSKFKKWIGDAVSCPPERVEVLSVLKGSVVTVFRFSNPTKVSEPEVSKLEDKLASLGGQWPEPDGGTWTKSDVQGYLATKQISLSAALSVPGSLVTPQMAALAPGPAQAPAPEEDSSATWIIIIALFLVILVALAWHANEKLKRNREGARGVENPPNIKNETQALNELEDKSAVPYKYAKSNPSLSAGYGGSGVAIQPPHDDVQPPDNSRRDAYASAFKEAAYTPDRPTTPPRSRYPQPHGSLQPATRPVSAASAFQGGWPLPPPLASPHTAAMRTASNAEGVPPSANSKFKTGVRRAELSVLRFDHV